MIPSNPWHDTIIADHFLCLVDTTNYTGKVNEDKYNINTMTAILEVYLKDLIVELTGISRIDDRKTVHVSEYAVLLYFTYIARDNFG